MAKLIYSTIISLDGYTEDKDGNFDWGEPDEQVHTFVNDLWRSFGTYLYGRRMYEVMIYWETAHLRADQPAYLRDFALIWQAADKIVYSKTLEAVSSERTRIERDFKADAISQMKTRATSDMTVGGRARRPGVQGRIGRRMPAVRLADRGAWRKAVSPEPPPPGARAPERTPFRQRRCLPSLPHRDLNDLSRKNQNGFDQLDVDQAARRKDQLDVARFGRRARARHRPRWKQIVGRVRRVNVRLDPLEAGARANCGRDRLGSHGRVSIDQFENQDGRRALNGARHSTS